MILQDASNSLGAPIELVTYVELINNYGDERVQSKPEAKSVKERLEQLNKISDNLVKFFEDQGRTNLLATHSQYVKCTMPGAEVPLDNC